MDSSKVSIVTVCLNTVNEIEATIFSVLNQSYANVEYIVVDGGSTDGTVDVIRKYQDRIAHFISEPDEGIYDAMNKGVDLAIGEWINFMNAGDYFASNTVIEEIMKGKNSDCDVLYGNTILVRGDHQVIRKGHCLENEFPKLSHQSVFVKTELMKERHFDLKYKISADFEFLYKLYKEGRNFCYKDIEVARFDMNGLSTTHRTLLYQEHCAIRGVKPRWYKLLKYRIEDVLPQKFVNWLSKRLYGKGNR